MAWMIRIALLVPIFLMATGCTPAKRSTPACERDSDCAADEICDDGTCVQVECKRLSDCEDGQVCLNNRCLPEETACQDDADCDPGYTCSDNECQPNTTCQDDTDCPGDLVCVQGACVEDSSCQTDQDCGPQERCIRQVCVEVTGCQVDGDCLADERCLRGACVDADYCERDADCQPGQICTDFTCVADPGCRSDADCEAPTPICDLASGDCVACVPDCTLKCCGDDGCGGTCEDDCAATGQVCDAGTCTCQGVCEPDCADRECGPDRCGDTCPPGCADGEICNDQGRCVCRPDCDSRECGPDGCGGQCQPGCGANESCDADGQCQACQPECGDRVCGPDPVCGASCGECGAGESCNLAGQCGPWCQTGQRRCTADGYGFEACGPDPDDPDTNTYGPRIPCTLGDACDDGALGCDRSDCLETESLVILDRSSSMLAGGTWDWVTTAVLAKLGEREAQNYFGYREFPYGGGCAVGPVVGMSKNNLLTIEASMTDPEMDSATPIAAALLGFVPQYGDPNDGQAAILISDGDETCDTQAEALQAAGALWRAGVQVHVIAVTQTANRAFLDQVAQAGGTAQARLVTSGVELRSALEAIFTDLAACRCAQGQTRCQAGELSACTQDGLGFAFETDCPLGCDPDGEDCERCQAGDTTCMNSELWTCSADGLDFAFDRVCPLGCDPNGLDCQSCSPGAGQCINGDLYLCNQQGDDYTFDHSCPNGCMNDFVCAGEMIYIPAGDVVRGSLAGVGDADEEPQATISLDAFYIDATEVTTAQYAACVQAGGCSAPTDSSSATRAAYYGVAAYANFPVINVTWYQAHDYCRWRSARLPTEAEWERAARGASGSTQTYPWGDAAATCTLANYLNCSGDTAEVGSHPTGASEAGLLDMAGNVYEWVHDWYEETYYQSSPAYNPLGPAEPFLFYYKSNRSGSWQQDAFYIRAANRAGDDPAYGDNEIGFRCARTPAGGDYDQDSWSPGEGDCDDLNPDVHPTHAETCGDGVDNDCDGDTDEDCGSQVTYDNDTDLAIPDGSIWVTSSISVGTSGTLTGVSVWVDITHTYIGDLQVVLRHPDGTDTILHDHTGDSADDIHQSYLVTAFNSKPMAGTWQLRIIDTATPDPGTLTYWSLTLDYN